MNDPLFSRLRESSWRRKLTAQEEAEMRAWLAEHPEMEAGWETEVELSEALSHLADAPVPANFTARVLQALDREPAGSRRPDPGWKWMWRSLLPKAAVAGLVVGLGVYSYEKHQANQRAEFAGSVAFVSSVPVPGPELLQDFETIRHLGQTPPADEELLALLK
jgi:anti-sigma factor RsiW